MTRTLNALLLLILGLPVLTVRSEPLSMTAHAYDGASATQAASSRSPVVERRGLDSVFAAYELLNLDPKSVAREAESSGRVTLELAGAMYELELRPTDLRSRSFRATLTTAAGVIEDAVPSAGTFKGTVAGKPDSDVRLSIRDDMFFGYVRTADDWLFVDPVDRYVPGAAPGQFVVYRKADVLEEAAGVCGVDDLERYADRLAGESEDEVAAKTAATLATPRVLEIATEADFEFFNAHPVLPNFIILGILNQVNGIYERDLNLTLTVTGMNIWTFADDPYTAVDTATLLGQFTDFWRANMDHVRRDVAHFFTGRRTTDAIGRAFEGVICNNPDFAFGVTRDLNSAETGLITAHELGHNLGAPHDSQSLCGSSGPIMCAFLQPGPGFFSQDSKNLIAAHLSANNSCLSTVAEFHTTDGTGRMSFLQGYTNWRASWDAILPGNFGGNNASDLVFYDRNAGHGEFYTTDGAGGIAQLQLHTNWRTTWDIIVPGGFAAGTRTELLFYDRAAGTGEFYTTDGKGGIRLLRAHTNWRGTWDMIIPGNFGGDSNADLLFYDRETGTGEFYTTNGRGGIRLLQTHTNWRGTWDMIIPGNFGGDGRTDLLFYDRETGFGEFYTTDGRGGIAHLASHDYWRTSWDMIVPGSFGGDSRTDLFFYDRNARQGEFYATDGSGGIAQLQVHDRLRSTWHQIIPGSFAGTSPTDLLFYER